MRSLMAPGQRQLFVSKFMGMCLWAWHWCLGKSISGRSLHNLRAEFAGISGCKPLTGFRNQSIPQSMLYGWQPWGSYPVWAEGHQTQQPVDGCVTNLQGTLLFKIDLVTGQLACISVGGAGAGSVLHAYARMPIPKVFSQSMHVRLDVQRCHAFELTTASGPCVDSLPISEAEMMFFDRDPMSARDSMAQ